MSTFDTFGVRLLKAMRVREMDFRRLRQETGLMQQSLAAYESDRVLPSYTSLTAIARALDMSIDYLVSADDLPRRLENRAPDRATFSQRLLLSRVARDLKQDGLAAMLGTHPQRISLWERGNTPGYWELQEIAKKLCVSIDFLCGFTDRARYA